MAALFYSCHKSCKLTYLALAIVIVFIIHYQLSIIDKATRR